jgi:hypothetical protein
VFCAKRTGAAGVTTRAATLGRSWRGTGRDGADEAAGLRGVQLGAWAGLAFSLCVVGSLQSGRPEVDDWLEPANAGQATKQ